MGMREPARVACLLIAAWMSLPAAGLRAQNGGVKHDPEPPVDSMAHLVAQLRGPMPTQRAAAQHQFRRLGLSARGALPYLIPLATDADAEIRLAAVGAVGAIGSADEASVAALSRAAADRDGRVQGEALTWLALLKTGASAAAPTLAALLGDEEPRIRSRAAASLGQVGVPASAVPRLLELLADSSERVRADAAYALRRAPHPERVVPALVRVLQDRSGGVAVNAALALGEAGRASPLEVVPALTSVLQGPRPAWVKAEAARALGQIGRPAAGAVPVLASALSDGDPDLREAVAWAIHQIAGPRQTAEAICSHRPTDGAPPVAFLVEDARGTLRGDAGGPYRHGEEGVQSSHGAAYNLRLQSPRDSTQRARVLVFDLTRPVPGSGAVPLGEIRDPNGRFHSFYMIDADSVIWNTQDVPIGTTVLSDRTQMNFSINGVPHLLQMGPWSLGDCGEGYARGGRLHGIGTTQAHISRISGSEYTITAPPGSVARLWDHHNPEAPVDRGLYYVQFRARLRPSR